MAALLTSVLDNSDKVAEYIAECRDCGIELLPPDVNRSSDGFTVEDGGIRFGLVAIKNIGRGFIQTMMRRAGAGRPLPVVSGLLPADVRLHGHEQAGSGESYPQRCLRLP